MGEKTRVDVNYVRDIIEKKAAINRLNFDDIVWMDGDKEIEVPPEVAEEFKFCGLSNMCFVEMEFWSEEVAEELRQTMRG